MTRFASSRRKQRTIITPSPGYSPDPTSLQANQGRPCDSPCLPIVHVGERSGPGLQGHE